jgi:hypothetical protein
MTLPKHSRTKRLPLALTLIAASFVSALLIATLSNKGADYWVINVPISPGHQVSATDISTTHMNLAGSAQLYLSTEVDPTGMIATRMMHPGEIISDTDLTSSVNAMSTSAVPISVRFLDVATGLRAGESVDIYWVLDTQAGENSVDPVLILGGVVVLSYEDGGNNFGSDVGLSIAVEETQVLRLLSATTQGRLVVIRSHV